MSQGAGFDFTKTDSLVLSYTSLDFESLLADLRVFAETRFSDTWTDMAKGSFEYMWLNVLAYMGDLLAYSSNAHLNETNILACKRLRNFMKMSPAYGYYLQSTFSASVPIFIKSTPESIPYLLKTTDIKVSGNDVIFMPAADTLITNISQTVTFVSGELLIKQLLGQSTGKKSQIFVISDTPLVEGSLVVYVNNLEWDFEAQLASAKSDAAVYFKEMEETGHINIIFGDNINGKIPPQGVEIRATYRVGGGAAGNLPKGTINTIVKPFGGVISIVNTDRGRNGTDILPLSKAKSALAGAVQTNRRAVTLEDHVQVLFDSRLSPPAGIEKASIRLMNGLAYLFVLATGQQPLNDSLKSAISLFLKGVTTRDYPPIPKDVISVNLQLTVSLFIGEGYNVLDLVASARKLLLTENGGAATGLLDYENLGLGGRDDEGAPQLTLSKIQNKLDVLKTRGVQKINIERLTTEPVTKYPFFKTNKGNGYLKDITTLSTSVRREVVLRWKSPTLFNVYQRIVGVSTYMTDDHLLDDRLNISEMSGLVTPGNTLYPGARLNPNRAQVSTVPLDVVLSIRNVLYKQAGVAASLFSLGSTGDEYYIEFLDTENAVLPILPGSEVDIDCLGDICSFTVVAGTLPFSTGDELTFDLYPPLGDLLLREDEMPQFERDAANRGINLIVRAKTAE